jgi:hypothetical protein
VLPEYEEKHIWWLVLQYLEDAKFTHTASAFKLELSCKGIHDEVLGLTKVRDGRESTCGTVGTPARCLAFGRGVDPVSPVIAGGDTSAFRMPAYTAASWPVNGCTSVAALCSR